MQVGFRHKTARLEMLQDGKHFRLIQSVHYSGKLGHSIIPRGYVTDFASIPWGLRNVVSPTGLHSLPAILHDFRYSDDHTITRKEADAEFLEAMQSQGVIGWKRWVMWLGVRAGGWKIWRDYERS